MIFFKMHTFYLFHLCYEIHIQNMLSCFHHSML